MDIEPQILIKEPDSLATVYVKNSPDLDSTGQTIDMLRTMPSVVSAIRPTNEQDLITVRFDSQKIRGSRIVQSLRKTGYQRSCIALMYFKDATDLGGKRNAAQTVIKQRGVIATERSAHKAYVLIVHFDPSRTQGSRIVTELRKQGYSAMIVGC